MLARSSVDGRYSSLVTALDVRPLSAPVSNEELKAFRRQNAFGTELIIRVFIVVIVVLVGAMVVVFLMDSTRSASGGPANTVLPMILILAVGAAFLALSALNSRMVWKRRCRISRFASSNGLVFAMRSGGPSYPGAIFNLGNNQAVTEQLFSIDTKQFDTSQLGQRQLDIGNYRYTTGSGKNKKTHTWGYVAIKLERKLPHMVLDARSNNFLGTNLPTSFSRDQILKLEGDFDRYFTLYCPRQYETDALYVFTPDLMALFIDEASQWDAEIIDDWMFLYSSGTVDLSDPTVMTTLFRIIDTVGDKTRDRSELYADSKLAGAGTALTGNTGSSRQAVDLIAPRGQRLTKGIPIAGFIIVGVIGVIMLVNFLPLFRSF